jgi:hypothetical protein
MIVTFEYLTAYGITPQYHHVVAETVTAATADFKAWRRAHDPAPVPTATFIGDLQIGQRDLGDYDSVDRRDVQIHEQFHVLPAPLPIWDAVEVCAALHRTPPMDATETAGGLAFRGGVLLRRGRANYWDPTAWTTMRVALHLVEANVFVPVSDRQWSAAPLSAHQRLALLPILSRLRRRDAALREGL